MMKSSNPWTEYYAAKSQPEKEAVLKKIFPDITQKELEIFRRKLPYPEDAKDDAAPKKVELTDEEIMDYANQLFLDSLPKLDGSDGAKRKKAANI